MTRIRREGLQRAVCAVDTLQHAIDAVRELSDLRLLRRTRQTSAELRWSDRPRLTGDALERPQRRVDRLASAARRGERRQRQEQRGSCDQHAERHEVGVAARDGIDVEFAHRAMQHPVAPAGALCNGRHEIASRPFEPACRHSRRQIIDLWHAAGVHRCARDDDLAAHAHELLGERGGHDAAWSAGRIAIRAEQRLNDVCRVLERTPQRHFCGDSEQQHHDRRISRQRRPGHASEPSREHLIQPPFRHDRSPRAGIPPPERCGSARFGPRNSTSCAGS